MILQILHLLDTLLNCSQYSVILYFCVKENKEYECIICGNKKIEEIKEMQPIIFINGNNINNTSIFNLFLSKYKEIYSYACGVGG